MAVEVDPISLKRIETCAPWLRQQLRDILELLAKRGVRIRIASAFRSIEEQAKLRAKYLKGGPLASPAGLSYHNYGLAVDCVIMKGDKEVVWDIRADLDKDGKADWLEMVEAFESWGWEAGYRWKGKKCDPPHFQKPFFNTKKGIVRLSEAECLSLYTRKKLKDGFLEVA
jgi:peptidoglycan L-alanyl-D-glutamate endopeptidase CwlK